MLIYHNNKTVKTIKELMDSKGIFETNDFTYKTFFDENRKKIFQQLNYDEKCELAKKKYGEDAYPDDLKESDLDYEMTLPFPCVLVISDKYVTTNLAITETNFQENTDDFFVFQEKEISKIVNNKYYEKFSTTHVKKQKCDVKVFGWFKVYHTPRVSENKTYIESRRRKFLDLSKYVQNVSTNVTKTGGNFRITLPVISAEKDYSPLKDVPVIFDPSGAAFDYDPISKKIVRYINTVEEMFMKETNTVNYGKNFFHKSTVQNFDNTLFNWLIQNNDLIFISFGDDIRDMEEDIKMRCFDMIGLVDSVSVSQNSNSNGSVVVSGRDLMKLITDDSSLFFNKSTAWNGENVFGNTESYMKTGDILSADMLGGEYTPVDRLRRLTNEINIFAYPNKTLDFIIKGVIQKLVNTQIVPDYVFEGWGNRRTKFNELEYSKDKSGNKKVEYIFPGDAEADEAVEADEELNEE